DSVVRVFSADPSRQAPEDAIRTYEAELASSKITVPDAAGTGDLDPNKLPGMEALLQPGRREGQVIVVRVSDRSVCYQWSGAETRWVEIGDVVGTGQSKLSVYNGKEYDFVFSVDIVDGAAPLKLPYNRTDDPWVAAQRFIHQHDLPQDYLDTVAQFIIKNAGPKISAPTSNDLAYVDPFTGADRYVPGTTGPTPPSSAASSDQHFPVNTFISLKSLSLDPLITKLKSFNQMVDNPIDESTIALIRAFNFDLSEDAAEGLTSAILEAIPRWPVDKVFPFLDLLRCLVFYNKASLIIFEESHWDLLYNLSLGHAELPQANCLLVLRLLANTLAADAPNLLVSKSAPPKSVVTVIGSSQKLVQLVDSTKLEIRQRKQHQIALAALIHNLAVFSYLSTSSHLSNTDFPYLRVLPSLCVRMGFSLLSLAPTHGPGGVTQFHPDAISTLILGIGTALISASHGDKNVQSEEMIKVHRIRLLASAVSANNGSTEDELAAWESVRRVITYWSQSSACSLKIKDKVRGSNPTSASRLPLSRLGQPGSNAALVLPSGGMAARHRKGVTAGRIIVIIIRWCLAMDFGEIISHLQLTGCARSPLLEQPGSIPALVQPSGGMSVRHRKGATAERFFLLFRTHDQHSYDILLDKSTSRIGSELSPRNNVVATEQFRDALQGGIFTKCCSVVRRFRCPSAMPPEGSTRARILPGFPSLDTGSREAEVGIEPRTLRSVDAFPVNLMFYLNPNWSDFDKYNHLQINLEEDLNRRHLLIYVFEMARWLKWLKREFTDRKVRDLGNLVVSQLSCLLWMAWQLSTERVLQLNDYFFYFNLRLRTFLTQHITSIRYFKVSTSAISGFLWDTFHPEDYKSGNSSREHRFQPVLGSFDVAVACFRCLTAMPPEGSTRDRILPGCPNLDRGSREAEVGFEPRTFQSVNLRSNH
ncbi:Phospholipase A-2-activating protein, partial [Clonorchis sinensis]